MDPHFPSRKKQLSFYFKLCKKLIDSDTILDILILKKLIQINYRLFQCWCWRWIRTFLVLYCTMYYKLWWSSGPSYKWWEKIMQTLVVALLCRSLMLLWLFTIQYDCKYLLRIALPSQVCAWRVNLIIKHEIDNKTK
jgi:hypothetical protein